MLMSILLQLLNTISKFGFKPEYSSKNRSKQFKNHNSRYEDNSLERLPEIGSARNLVKNENQILPQEDALNLQISTDEKPQVSAKVSFHNEYLLLLRKQPKNEICLHYPNRHLKNQIQGSLMSKVLRIHQLEISQKVGVLNYHTVC